MKAVRLASVRDIGVADVPEPNPAAGEIVVHVAAAGMCGSDRHLVSGDYPSVPPVTLGHEFEGTVVAAGPGCSMVVGTRVTVDPNIACGRCRYCRLGLFSHCQRLSAYGVDRDGGFAEYATVLESQAYELPTGLEPHLGALAEPLSCCLRAIDHARIEPGQSVAVIGGGVIGQLLVQLSRLAGATDVVLATRQRKRRGLAESLGATASVDPNASDTGQAIAGPSGIVPGGVDVAFDAAGAQGTLGEAIGAVRSAGSVIVVGAAPQSMLSEISPFDIFARELRIQGSHLNPLTHGRAAALIASGVLRLTPLVTGVLGLADLPRALTTPPGDGEVKTLVLPS
jgi:2-desacetyl-2-hydroxyethyl bacteriochlorophyllide A dehydrogenase